MMAAGDLAAFFLAIRSEVLVAAPIARVWSHLDRPGDWKPSIVAIEHLAGTPGTEGERLRVAQRPGDRTVPVLMETVRLEAPRWRVQTLVTEDGPATDGYVIYSLSAADDGTRVDCEVIARCALPRDALDESPLEEFARRVNADTRRKLDDDLHLLKALCERAV